MSAAMKAQIRDRRKPGWFRVDDELLEVYGPEIGVHGVAVYAALCKYANSKDESCYPSLNTLCKQLKIGRAKLLSTLAQLEQLELISIEHGDRVSVNVYTLLDVPKTSKGGSRQNHVGEGGGSNQNQGWFSSELGGGSNQNSNQTHREPNPINQREHARKEKGELHYLNEQTQQCVSTLQGIKGWQLSEQKTLELVAESQKTYPAVDVGATATSLAFKLRTGAYRSKRPSQAFVNWVAREGERAASNPAADGTRVPGGSSEAASRRQEGYEWLFNK